MGADGRAHLTVTGQRFRRSLLEEVRTAPTLKRGRYFLGEEFQVEETACAKLEGTGNSTHL